jgi:hypothetical protein
VLARKRDRFNLEQFGYLLTRLAETRDANGPLLDTSMVLFGSGMGNANSHTNNNLPIILAGGGFKHGEHKTFATNGPSHQMLCNLYLSMLQRFGVEAEKFGTSTGTLTGLV